jgi:predicted nucleic-acid-binding Zn-ribbon protein
MKLVTIAQFDNNMDAHLLKSRIEDEEILCFLNDEYMMGVTPMLNFSLGGVRVKVREEDEARAREIMEEIENTFHIDDNDNIITCPNCGSTDFYHGIKSIKSAKSKFSMIIALLLSVFPFSSDSVNKCKVCDTEFES